MGDKTQIENTIKSIAMKANHLLEKMPRRKIELKTTTCTENSFRPERKSYTPYYCEDYQSLDGLPHFPEHIRNCSLAPTEDNVVNVLGQQLFDSFNVHNPY